MKILVMCGAGASSTFVAQRLQRAMRTEGLHHDVQAATTASLLHSVDTADIVLLGPHMADMLESLRNMTHPQGTAVALLPEDISQDHDGKRALALVHDVLAAANRE